jgi:hypothetical protein
MPSSTQVGFAIEDGDVVVSEALELDRCADAAEARPHDQDFEVLRTHDRTVPYFRVSL